MANVIEILVTGKNESKAAVAEAKADSTSLKDGLDKLGVGGGLALAAIGYESVKMAAQFEASSTRLVTSAGESSANIDMVKKGMLDMAGQVGISANDLAQGMYTVESAGFHGAEGLTVLKAAAQGAKAENADLGTVANAVTDVLVDYHLKAASAATVTSQLITAVSYGKTSFEDFSGAMHNVLPLASALHLSIGDVSGVLAEMTAHGVSADQASQNIANAMRSLAAPTGTMQKEFQLLGISSDEVHAKLGTAGLAGTMQWLSQVANDNAGAVGQNATEAMKKLMGTAPGLQVALMTTGENFTATTAAIKGISGATADANGNVKGFSDVQKTLKFQMDAVGASLQSIMIELGDKLMPIFKDFFGYLADHKVVIEAVAVAIGVVAVAATLKLAGSMTSNLLTGISKAVTGLTGLGNTAVETAGKEDAAAASTTGLASKIGGAVPIIGSMVVGAVALGTELGKLAGVGDHTGQSLTNLTTQMLAINNGVQPATQGMAQLTNQLMFMSQKINDNKPVQGLQDIDTALAQLVTSGHAQQAEATVNDITTALTKQGVSLGYIHDQVLPKYNQALQDASNNAQLNATATDGSSTALSGNADQANNAADAQNNLAIAIQAANDAFDTLNNNLTASDALHAFQKDLLSVTDTIKTNGTALDSNTLKGLANLDAFNADAKHILDYRNAQIAAAGGTKASSDAIDQANTAANTQVSQLIKVWGQAGANTTQITAYAKSLGLIPDTIPTTVDLNTETATQKLHDLQNLMLIVGNAAPIAKGGTKFQAHGGEVAGAATGGDRTGLVMVGEQGPELVRLPTGSTVRSNPDTMAAIAGGGGVSGGGRGGGVIQLELVGNPSDPLLQWLRGAIRARFGNDPDSVQKALGQT
jgi:TP901 family phage tail tape measure protein